MKITVTEKVYCFEMSTVQMRRLLRKDAVSNERADRESMRKSCRAGADTLASKLLLVIPGVREVEYDGMFGPCLWVRIEEPSPEDTLQKVKEAIEAYVKQ